MTKDAIVGSVSVDRVILRRHRPLLNNSFAPFYRAKFVFDSGLTKLEGAIQLHLFVRIFMTFWFGFLALAVPLSVLGGISEALAAGEHWALGLAIGLSMAGPAFVMMLFGYGLLRFGRWLASDDQVIIEAHVCDVLDLPAA